MNQSLAQTFLGFGGNTLSVLGTVFEGLGLLFGIHTITGYGTKVCRLLPQVLKGESDDNNALMTTKQVVHEATVCGKLTALILLGIVCKCCGTYISSPKFVAMVDNAVNGPTRS